MSGGGSGKAPADESGSEMKSSVFALSEAASRTEFAAGSWFVTETCWAWLGVAGGGTAVEGSGEVPQRRGRMKEGMCEQSEEKVDEHGKEIKMELGSDQNSSRLSDRDQS